jgi:hypothetical protein
MRRNHWFGVAVLLALLGTAAPEAEAKGSVRITFTTTPVPGTYSPNNVVAAWIQNTAGAHQKTVGLWSAVRTQYLLAYRLAAGVNDSNALPADAVSGASRLNHQGALTVVWNLRDKAGTIAPDGTYTIRLELADSNATSQAQNHEGTFTFVKGPNPPMSRSTTIRIASRVVMASSMRPRPATTPCRAAASSTRPAARPRTSAIRPCSKAARWRAPPTACRNR